MNISLIEHKHKLQAQVLESLKETKYTLVFVAEKTGLSVAWLNKFKASSLPSEPKAEQIQALDDFFKGAK